MKELVTERSKEIISFNDLKGNEIVAYRSQGGGGYCILAKVGYKHGFIPLNNSSSNIRFEERTWFEAVRKASMHRKIFVFNSMKEMISAMFNETF